ncbi:carbohydrate-binding domain-containing protein [Phnomibacter ginsenosidimutans]|uniref:Carbohydrate-binding domain-containing protein n=1 Tax=Phnomibacter ginsenosidimutans TaxID=2676868 RepID=A0A6I6GXJ0_9BACT|nr:carbohydrate-binding domain-containing protein [Phnomibacter ginsenosidimutans]QGW29799.1 carbohydrate-binding domain-containing protein [Phnomibacter ginsenosidimutans]
MQTQLRTSALLLSSMILIMLACKKEDVSTTTTDMGSSDFVANTLDTTFANAVVIKYNGNTATVTNGMEGNGVAVTINNGDVVVTATTTSTEVNYVLSGIATNGSLKVYSDYKFNLIFNGTSITNDDGPAINIQSGKKVSVNVLTGTNNRLIDGSTYSSSTEDQKATFFSEGQLVFSGTGTLAVTGNYKHGICSDDYISITNGNIDIVKASSDGIHANDYFNMDAGTIKVTAASSDGIECEEGYITINGGNISVNSVDDGIVASYEDADASITPYISIKGGSIVVTTTGEKGNALKSESYTSINSSGTIQLSVSGKGAKGIKTGGDCLLSNGSITISTTGAAFYDTDDADITAPAGINCDGNLTMDNGSLTITSTGAGGKGISVDGNMTMNAGTAVIKASGTAFTYGTDATEAKGIKTDGSFVMKDGNLSIAATDDGLKSESAITIHGGNVTITQSTEGIEAPAITFAGGVVSVVSSDDCVNGTMGNGGETTDASLITFAGGTILLNTTGGDGIDGNGNVVMTGGSVLVQGPPSSPEVGIDVNGSFTISGGLLLASGPNAGNQIEATSSNSSQYTMLVKFSSVVSAGSLINIQNAAGTSLVTFAPLRNAYYLVYSSAALSAGSSYKVYTGGSISGSTNTNGWHIGGTYSNGTLRGTITLNSKLTTATL